MNDPRQVTSIHTATQIDRTSLDAHITRTLSLSPSLSLSLPISLSYTCKVFERIKNRGSDEKCRNTNFSLHTKQ